MRFTARHVRNMLLWLLAGILPCGAVLLTMFPAAWVTPQFARMTHGHVNLANPEGSLWNGSASLMLAAGPNTGGATLLPGRVEWHTAFWPLFAGRVRMRIRQTDAMPTPVTIEAGLHDTTVSAGGMGVPASLLNGLGTPFNTLGLEGNVQLVWGTWRLYETGTFGKLDVRLDDISSRASPVRPLGSYEAVVQGQGPLAVLDLSTLKGPLLLNGHGILSRQSVSFQGTASTTQDQRDSLTGLLNLLGRPTAPGTVALTFCRGNCAVR